MAADPSTLASSTHRRNLPTPRAGERNILITSALPYVNNVPHLGNIIGCVLSADVFARYCRARGINTLYICGTDEYGTATETKALQEGLTPQQICDKYHKIHADIYRWFDIAFDEFGRTTTKEQTEIAQDIFLKLHARGHLVEQTIQQLYCTKCAKFLADRFVEGTCPKCGYDDARGDQCDKCGQLLDPVELIKPRCKIDGSTPEVRDTEHMFLNLPELHQPLSQWVEASSAKGKWTTNANSITKTWLARGLEPRCITRDLKWGTSVPLKKYKEKVFYVWFDAPIGYISITAHVHEQWEAWWKAAPGTGRPEVELFQFMGKDNVPFHTVIFPASLIGSGDPYTLLHHVSTTEYLNYEDTKFSKSRGTGVFGTDVTSLPIPPEVWRYFLLANRPEQSDSAFTWEDFSVKCNTELLANLGNFVNRILKFVASKLDGKIPSIPSREELLKSASGEGVDAAIAKLIGAVDEQLREYIRALDGVHIKEGLRIAMAISGLGNKFQQDHKPWELLATNRALCERIVGINLELAVLVASLIEPYLPGFAVKVASQLALPNAPPIAIGAPSTTPVFRIDGDTWRFPKLPAGHQIGVPEPLFPRLEENEVSVWRERFADKEKKETFPLDVRVGRVLEAADHPQADKLYVLKIDVGEQSTAAAGGAQPRQVVAGIKAHYTAAELVGRNIALVCNLKPTKFKSVASQGMILAAVEGDRLGVLVPPEGAAPGARVSPAGFATKFKAAIDHKKDFLPLNLRIADNGHATFVVGERSGALAVDGHALTADKGIGAGAKIQ